MNTLTNRSVLMGEDASVFSAGNVRPARFFVFALLVLSLSSVAIGIVRAGGRAVRRNAVADVVDPVCGAKVDAAGDRRGGGDDVHDARVGPATVCHR